MDITEELERSFGDGPAHRAVEERIAAGRRMVVRRRVAAGAGATAAALVIGGVAWATAPGGTTGTSPDLTPVATQPPTSATQPADAGSAGQTPKTSQDPLDQLVPGQHAALGLDGKVILRDGWTIVRRIPNPLDLPDPLESLGLEITNGKDTFYYLLEIDGSAWDPAGKGHASLESWLDSMVALRSGEPEPSPVEFRPGTAELAAVAGAAMVRQQANPDVPGFAGPGDTTAAAKVEWRERTYFVLARQVAGSQPEYFPIEAAVLPAPTMAAFLEHVRARYGSGEGLR